MSTRQARVSILAGLGLAYVLNNGGALPLAVSSPPRHVLLLPYGFIIAVFFLAPRLWPAGSTALRRDLLLIGVVTGSVQVAWLFLAGSTTEFGISPFDLSSEGIAATVINIGVMLVAVELARAYMVADRVSSGIRVIVVVTLLFACLQLPLARLLAIEGFEGVAEFLGARGLPVLAENLFATLLAFLAGPLPAIAYRGILAGFESLSPVLPDLTWGLRALIGTVVPALGFLVVEALSAGRLRGERRSGGRASDAPNLALGGGAIAGVLLLWFVLRLLPFHATAIAGGSMRPELDYGDLVIAAETDADGVQEGDIIEFIANGGAIVHRVVSVDDSGSTLVFFTKGDANEDIDPRPITADDLRGKIVWSIPRAGWMALTFRD